MLRVNQLFVINKPVVICNTFDVIFATFCHPHLHSYAGLLCFPFVRKPVTKRATPKGTASKLSVALLHEWVAQTCKIESLPELKENGLSLCLVSNLST